MDQLILFAEDSRARTYRWPDAALAWLESEVDYGGSSVELLGSLGRDGLLSKTSPAFYPATPAGILPPSFAGWSSAGIASPGGCWTLSISEFPSDGAACSLLEVLETDVAPKYFLSPSACRGILRRAGRRNKKLPERLEAALKAVVADRRT